MTPASTEHLTAPIRRILTVIAASQFLTDAVPISAMLIASPDAGKSGLLLRHLPANARVLDDLTTASLTTILQGDKEHKTPRVIVLPDLNMVISHKPSVASLLMSCLLPLMGEGLTELPAFDSRSGAKLLVQPENKETGLRVAILTAITHDIFASKRGKWRATGFLRRLAPIHYTYDDAAIDLIQSRIRSTRSTLKDYPRVYLPTVAPGAPTIPAALARQLDTLSRQVVTDQLVWRHQDGEGREHVIRSTDLPFSAHKTLRTFTRASALLHKRRAATGADWDAALEFARFMRYDRPEVL